MKIVNNAILIIQKKFLSNVRRALNVTGNVDVNVSPTKNEVTFLNEDMIINEIKGEVEGVEGVAHSARTGVLVTSTRLQSNAPAKAPEKIEVFIDDQPVMVLPGTTVLQVL